MCPSGSMCISALVEGRRKVVANRDKADVLGRTFKQVHSANKISSKGQLRREIILEQKGYNLSKAVTIAI